MGFVSGSVQEWLSQPGLGLGPQQSYPKLRGTPALPAWAEALGAPGVGVGGQDPGISTKDRARAWSLSARLARLRGLLPLYGYAPH